MEIVDFIAAKFSDELVGRFRELVEAQKIPLDLMRDKPNQEVLARWLMGEIARLLADKNEPKNKWIDISVNSYMLHILGAETAGEVIDEYQRNKNTLPSTGAASAVAVPLCDID